MHDLAMQQTETSAPPVRRTAGLADLCNGDRYLKGDPDARAAFPVAALEYTASPDRNIAFMEMDLPGTKYLKWIDTGAGIMALLDPRKVNRRTALVIVEIQSGKTLIDVTDEVMGQ
jgi:hypothetical protein